MGSVAESIQKAIARQREGVPVLARQFLQWGSRAAVDQALSRLCREGVLLRAARGIYVRPITSRFGERPPSVEKVVEALSLARGETVAPSGAAAANSLGLTSQVPIRMVYLTNGKARRLKLGAQEVELRKAPVWQLLHPHEVAGQVIRALAWLGPEEAPRKLPLLKRKLTAKAIMDLSAMTSAVPPWMARQLSTLANG